MTLEDGPDRLHSMMDARIPVALGGSVFGWIVSPAETDPILDEFFRIGGRFIDTSDGYSYASRETREDSENLIGSWIERRGLSDSVRIITKVGLCPGALGLAPHTVSRAVEASLARLRIPRAAAVLAHADDTTTPPEHIAEGLAALIPLRAERIGLSGFSCERFTATVAAIEARTDVPHPLLLQEELSLVERTVERVLASARHAIPIRILTSASLARGFLTGKFEGSSPSAGHRRAFVEDHYRSPAFASLIDTVRSVAHDHGVSPAAVALRWLVQHPAVGMPLASVTDVPQLGAFTECASLRLTDGEWRLLDVSSRAATAATPIERR